MLAASNAIIIDCNYSMKNWAQSGIVYTCDATINTLGNNEAITAVTDFGATADPTLQTSDVKWFVLTNAQNLRVDHFPSNMATIFPNLVGIIWVDSRLKSISPADLSPYPSLIFFAVSRNMIRKLDGKLFQNNKKLQQIDYELNAIQEIGPGLLNALTWINLHETSALLAVRDEPIPH